MNAINLKFRSYIPLTALILALLTLGIILFKHVALSQQPPLFDALNYAQKAHAFWNSVEQFRWFNPQTWISPLNLTPTTRPPGTIAMSYPLGFSRDCHGFFFRSIYIPIVLFAAALWIIAEPCCLKLQDQWLLVALCLAFITIPLFYHFEPNDLFSSPTYWGLVDNFFASTAALATAVLIRSIYKTSYILTFVGIVISAFCLFIKPAGIFTMFAIFWVWVVYVWAARKSLEEPSHSKKFQKYIFFSLANYTYIYGIAILLSLTSHYFSRGNMAYGKRAMELLREEWFIREWWDVFKTQIHTSFNWYWLTFIILTCAFSLFQTRNRAFVDIISALGVLLLGLWFWLIATGQSQIRYFFPFALIALTLCFPRVASFWIIASKQRPRNAVGAFLCPFVLLLFLLLPRNAPSELQHFLGTNLTSGSLVSEVKQAKSLVEEARSKQRDLNIYSFSVDPKNGMFMSVGVYEKILQPNMYSFNTKLPVDWIRESTFRLSEITPSDYLLFTPIKESVRLANTLNKVEVADFTAETELFNAWLSTANTSFGVEIISETSLRLLKITERLKFSDALDRLLHAHKWGKAFRKANFIN